MGGCCVTEEIVPGCRASTTSYVASMLRPTVIRDLDLGAHGLRMVPCDPGLLVPFPQDDEVLAWWADRRPHSCGLSQNFRARRRNFRSRRRTTEKTRSLPATVFPGSAARSSARGVGGWLELFRVGKRFRGISGEEIAQLVSFLTGSLGDFLDRHYESEKIKTLFLANNVYGKHGGPYDAGSALGLLFHLLSGGEGEIQGFYGHVIGGMGSITQALAHPPAASRDVGDSHFRSGCASERRVADLADGVSLEDGTEISSRIVLSNADPKRTFLSLVDAKELPDDFRSAIGGIKMDGPCAKVNFVLERGAAGHRHARRIGRSRSAPCLRWFPRLNSPSAATTLQNSATSPKNSGSIVSSLRTPITRSRLRAHTS